MIAQIKGGAKFEDLAKKESKDPGSGQRGGDLDWGNAANYHIALDSGVIGIEKCAKVIENLA